MALLMKFRRCPLHHRKFSSAFVLCFHDALYTALIKSGQFHFSLCHKFPLRKFCSVSTQRNNLIVNYNARQAHTNLVQSKLQTFSSDENVPDAFTQFSSGVDFDALRDARIKEFKLKGKEINITQIVRDIVKEKCDEALANLNKEDQRKLKIVQLEHDVLYSQGYHILPAEEMTSENWLDAINMTSSQRHRLFRFLQNVVDMKQNNKKKKALKKRDMQEQEQTEQERRSAARDNRIFLRLYGSTIKRWQNIALASSLQYGIPLIWDMDYCAYMNSREIRNTATQLISAYCLNRSDKGTPFHLHFTNCPADNPVFNYIQWYLQNDPHFMATVTPQSCVDLFDRKDLVYLSPHAPEIMTEFDPTAVYIMGGFNDMACQRPISYAKAKELGVKTVKLPVDKYVNWRLGSKSLTLNQMMMIFQAIKNGTSWFDALMAVPTRKIDKLRY